MLRQTPLMLTLFSFLMHAHAQEYSNTPYNIKEGLAGSTVYCAVQDKDGFMWFGTETGLSRFDGVHFKNFTTADGLSNNEILKVFCDSKGRVWLSPFKKDVCYYFKGKIYNRNNDPMLSRIHMTDIAWQICEDDHENILIMEKDRLHKITNAGLVVEIDSSHASNVPSFHAIAKGGDGNFLVCINDKLYRLTQENTLELMYQAGFLTLVNNYMALSPSFFLWKNTLPAGRDGGAEIFSFAKNKKITFQYNYAHISYTIINDSIICDNTAVGALLINPDSPSLTNWLIKDKPVSSVYMDNEKNIWCTTLNNGVYRINSLDFKNLLLVDRTREKKSAYSFLFSNNDLIIGGDDNQIAFYDQTKNKFKRTISFGDAKLTSKIVAMENIGHNKIIVGSDGGTWLFDRYTMKWDEMATTVNVKSFCKINDDSLLIANKNALILINPKLLAVKDTLWKDRTTSVFFKEDSVYAGTLDGLLLIDKHKRVTFLYRKYPQLANIITGFVSGADGTIWISTYGAGIIGLQNGNIVAQITIADGLTSNLARCISIDGNIIWVGTDKGLNKVDIAHMPYVITKISSSDALISDMINQVVVHKGIVYVATPEGTTYFNPANIVLQTRLNVVFTRIIAGQDTLVADIHALELKRYNRNISFEFAGISFRSAGDITYYYRLKGLNDQWQKTQQNFINYTTLPPGKYVFELKAINKFGVSSTMLTIPVDVVPAIWETLFFKILSIVFAGIIVALVMRSRIRYIKHKNSERLHTMQHMAELEQMALKSQMNPHFIFNCLNSIQQYVMDKDISSANKFLTGFSKLIRKTLDFSSRQYITLYEELEYITTYLELEKERLSSCFTYTVNCDAGIKQPEVMLPPMILQPYIENSIRHGIRYRKDREGVVAVNVSQYEDSIKITIQDNGIGRKEAEKYKTLNSIQYQSKGMSLTANRIEMLNKYSKRSINVKVEDLENAGIALGTKVTVDFPLTDIYNRTALS